MDSKQQKKLERYLRNANRFIWGLGRIDQAKTYQWLDEHGFTDNGERFKHSYKYTAEVLIKDYGIERILQEIIKPRIDDVFRPKLIRFLRECWKKGECPTVDKLIAKGFGYILEGKKLAGEDVDRDPTPFLLYNEQFKFIRGWGEMAGIWFEEIEPLLDSKGESLSGSSDAKSELPVSVDYVDSAEALLTGLEQIEEGVERLRPLLGQSGKHLKQRIGRVYRGRQELNQPVIDETA